MKPDAKAREEVRSWMRREDILLLTDPQIAEKVADKLSMRERLAEALQSAGYDLERGDDEAGTLFADSLHS